VLTAITQLYVDLDLDRTPRSVRVIEEILGRVAEDSNRMTIFKLTATGALPLLRAAVAEADRQARGGALARFLHGEFLEAVAAWKALNFARADELRARNWQELRSTLRQWATEGMEEENPSASPVSQLDHGGYRALCLNTPVDLVLEGLAMNHCAGTYAWLLDRNDQSFFSIRDARTGTRLATLGLARRGLAWKVHEISGVSNRPVRRALRVLARDIAVRYTWAYLRQTPFRIFRWAASALAGLVRRASRGFKPVNRISIAQTQPRRYRHRA
jgi:hypothetical protein